MSASSSSTFVAALSTENLNVVVCRFSKTHSQNAVDRLDYLEKCCLPMRIDAFNDKLLVGNLSSSESNKNQLKESLKIVSRFLLSARTSLQLGQLAQLIKDKGNLL